MGKANTWANKTGVRLLFCASVGVFAVAKVQLMGQREYARHRGCAVSSVANAISEGRISVIVDEKGRKWIDPEVADIQWGKNTRARADSGRSAAVLVSVEALGAGDAENASTGPDSQQPDSGKAAYLDTRALTEQETLRQKRRENLQAERQLVEVVQVRRIVFDAFRALRDKCMSVPQQTAPKCIGVGDAREIERVFSEDLRAAFADWENHFSAQLPEPEGLEE